MSTHFLLRTHFPSPSLTLPHLPKPKPHRRQPLFLRATTNSGPDGPDLPPPPPVTPPDAVEIRFRRGSAKRRKQQKLNQTQSSFNGETRTDPQKTQPPPKKWEEMTLSEKALELYLGEKGALFWLNKFAYASIFIVIGGWILFRFVGPALNLYQLDSPPLAPDAIFKGK